jgi:hypothetical protein
VPDFHKKAKLAFFCRRAKLFQQKQRSKNTGRGIAFQMEQSEKKRVFKFPGREMRIRKTGFCIHAKLQAPVFAHLQKGGANKS